MEQAEFLQIWRRSVGSLSQRQLPSLSVYDDSWQEPEPERALYTEQYRKQTAAGQAQLFADTRRQAELDLLRLGWAEWLYVRGIEVSALHIDTLYNWAYECSSFCHPKAQAHIEMMVEQGAAVLSRLPMAAFIQNMRRYGLG